ncbi:MAG: NCS2 family permease [Bacteroidales bacterium]|jgi:AGZA family xanthine/uracil permease-like MFS transporter|nr:NCS2 family permease [Bacteroidales bacterium]HOD69250.1 NCS2 family permease [Bacteroidaceae bacterium]
MTALAKLFGFEEGKHSVRTEILAGITTFLTMSYILAVNPDIFGSLEAMGMPKGAVFTATGLAAIVGTLVMSLYAKKPFALAPGLGLNAFFVYTVCLTMGYSWQFALTAVFIEGLIFILLTLTNVREAIINAIPASMKSAISVGIGLFIAFIGMVNAGIIVDDGGTIITLGNITSGPALLAVIGLLITSIMLVLRIPGAILVGILITAVLGIFFKMPLPADAAPGAVPEAVTQFGGVMSAVPSIKPIFLKFEWTHIFSLDMLVVVFTFLFIDIFDTIGTVIGVSKRANMMNPDGTIPGVKKILMADAVATVAGAAFGTSTTTTYVESAAGVAVGGRTGLTSFTTAICFVIALFFAPLFLAIPSAATAPALIVVGVMMMSTVKDIEFDDFSESIPAYITLIVMPLAYSISDGIMLGLITYVVINLVCGIIKKIKDKDEKMITVIFNILIGRFGKINPMMWVLSILFVLRYIFL